MMRFHKKITLIVMAVLFNISMAFCGDFNLSEARTTIEQAVQKINASGIQDKTLEKYISMSKADEEDVISACEKIEKYFPVLDQDVIKSITGVKDDTIKYLRGFVVTGTSFCCDFNAGLIVDMQDPEIVVSFENSQGLIKTRNYQLKIWSIGLKLELALNLELVKVIGSSFNYYDANKPMHLGYGVEISPQLKLMYCDIKELRGAGVLIVGLAIGISYCVSCIFGGTMAPVRA